MVFLKSAKKEKSDLLIWHFTMSNVGGFKPAVPLNFSQLL
jgi:hypothetical protein